jgi:hypothetical protein
VTVRAVAAQQGVSEMSVYRRTGGLAQLRLFIADGIVARADFSLPACDDPEDELVEIARRLRSFVLAHPGIGEHLLGIVPEAAGTLERIEEGQASFAARHGLSPAHASVLLSTVAEHAVALASMDPLSHRTEKDPAVLSDAVPTIRAGAAFAAHLTPDDRFTWSMRATVRGALLLLGLPVRDDAPPEMADET